MDGYYYCPHHPTKGQGGYKADCNCRKPGAGLFWQAIRGHGIRDLAGSWAVGDRMRDLEPGDVLGCRKALVLTGQGAREELEGHGDIEVFQDIGTFAEGLRTLAE